MKTKDIKKIIQSNIESHIPKSAPKIDFPFEVVHSNKTIRTKPIFKWSYGFTLVLSVLILALVFSLFPGEAPITPTPNKLLGSEEEIISFSALSTVSLLSSTSSDELLSFQPQPLNTIQQPPIINYVKPYLDIVESLLSNQSGFVVVTGESEYEEYTTFMEFQVNDLLGNKKTYIMHYNLILLEADEEELEYSIEGILLVGNQHYIVFGEKKIEEGEESLTFKAMKDQNNYVESFIEIESDKQSFEYKVVQFGQVVSESIIEIEFDEDEIKIKLEFIEGNDFGEFEFEFKTENGLKFIYIEFETEINGREVSGEMTVQVIVDSITGKTTYRIYVDPDDEESYEYDFDREDDDDEEDEDEDDDEEYEDDDDDDNDETEEI